MTKTVTEEQTMKSENTEAFRGLTILWENFVDTVHHACNRPFDNKLHHELKRKTEHFHGAAMVLESPELRLAIKLSNLADEATIEYENQRVY